MDRLKLRSESNNQNNPNKNICTSYVASMFGVENATRYLQTTNDVVRALRTKYKVRSCKSEYGVQKGLTVAALKNKMRKGDTLLITVDCHILALCLKSNGDFITIDTDINNRRKVTCLYRITKLK